jgi:hypothetical protein
MLNVICVAVLIAMVALLVRATVWVWRARIAFLKWAGVSIGVVLIAIFAAAASVMTAGLYRLHARSAPVPDLKVAGTPEQIGVGAKAPPPIFVIPPASELRNGRR